MRSKIYKKYSLIFLVALLNVSTFSLWSGYALSYKTYSTYFESVSTRIVRIGQKIYEVEHYTTTSEYPALEASDLLVLGGSTLLRESANETRRRHLEGDGLTLGAGSTVTDDGGSTAMLIAALAMSPYFRTSVFGMGDIINNWVGFTEPSMQILLESRFGDFKGAFKSKLEEKGIEVSGDFLKLAQKSAIFSQHKESIFLEGTPNGLSKGLERAIEECGFTAHKDEIIRVGLKTFEEIKNIRLVDKTKEVFGIMEARMEEQPDIWPKPGHWEIFKANMLDLARVVDEKFIDRGVVLVEGQSLRNLIFIGAMYVAGYLNESTLDESGNIIKPGYVDESKLNDALTIIGDTFGVKELGFAAPVSHEDALLVAITTKGDEITTQTDISRFTTPIRWPVGHLELWKKDRNPDGTIVYDVEGKPTYDGDVKPVAHPGGKLNASEQIITNIKNAKKAIYLPCGSAETSIAPVLMTDGIPQALAERKEEGIPVVLFLKPHQDSETVGLDILGILQMLEKSMQIATGTDLKIDDVISHVVIFNPKQADLSEAILDELSRGMPKIQPNGTIFQDDGSMYFDPSIKGMFGEKTPRGLTAVVDDLDPDSRFATMGAEDRDTFEAKLQDQWPDLQPVYISSEKKEGSEYLYKDILIYWPGGEGEAKYYPDDWLVYPAGIPGVHGADEFRFRFRPQAIRDTLLRIIASPSYTGP